MMKSEVIPFIAVLALIIFSVSALAQPGLYIKVDAPKEVLKLHKERINIEIRDSVTGGLITPDSIEIFYTSPIDKVEFARKITPIPKSNVTGGEFYFDFVFTQGGLSGELERPYYEFKVISTKTGYRSEETTFKVDILDRPSFPVYGSVVMGIIAIWALLVLIKIFGGGKN